MISSNRLRLVLFPACCLSAFAVLSHVHAAEDTAPTTPAPAPQATTPAPLPLETMLAGRGEITVDDLLKDSGLNTANLSPAVRARIASAVEERNEDLRRANFRVADAIRRALNVSDVQIKQSMDEEKERRRMERIRQFQPARYEALMRQKKQQAAQTQPTPQPTQ